MSEGNRFLAAALAAAAFAAPAGCAQPDGASAGSSATVSGTVTYLQRAPLPTDAMVTIELRDVSRQGAPAVVVASTSVAAAGRNNPVPFSLSYDPAKIDTRGSYTLYAEILVDGKPRLRTTEPYPVLTRDRPSAGLKLVLRPSPPAE
jgi:putative lipoprotein